MTPAIDPSRTHSRSASTWAIRIGSTLLLLALTLPHQLRADTHSTNSPAKIKVSGYGILGNRELKKTITLLHTYKDPEYKPTLLDADFLEDSALIILSLLADQGYLQSKVITSVTTPEGDISEYTWTQDLDTVIPRTLRAVAVRFRIVKGLRSYYESIEFHGLQTITEAKAMGFFIETGTLLRLKKMRIYTPSLLQASIDNVTAALNRQGYANASVTVSNLVTDPVAGSVRLEVHVRQGVLSMVRSIQTETPRPDLADTNTLHPNTPYSRVWVQDFVQAIKTNHYKHGFPDTTATVSTTKKEELPESVQLDLTAKVDPGPQIKLGQVHYEGAKRTRPHTLRDRVKLVEGEPLDTLEVERGRFRLSRLGIFDSVGVRYEQVDPETRDVVYELEEGKVIDFSLLFGYGSYELLRGGFELEQHNVWGRGHQARLRAHQSFKSSSGDYLYSMPELFYEDINAFFSASALLREEISFDREEFAAAVGAQRFFPSIRSDLTVSYNYELLTANKVDFVIPGARLNTRVSSIKIDLKHDERDNPLIPRHGYSIYSKLELASATLGGEVDYQRWEMGGSLHFRLGPAQYAHLGISQGVLTTYGGSRSGVPFNKRFFPGGENSVRGFQLGEAGPRDGDGEVIGAEAYLLGNVEFEQIITPAWSVVAFFDGLGVAEDIADYPFSEQLYSAGLGLRWKTFIGPARLEYGRNLNPRRHDPAGTLHFAIGFPF